jgi:hypothetical protein
MPERYGVNFSKPGFKNEIPEVPNSRDDILLRY